MYATLTYKIWIILSLQFYTIVKKNITINMRKELKIVSFLKDIYASGKVRPIYLVKEN